MPLPPKSKEGAQDLHEVERALSVLQGRHPEHERARREDESARAKRAAELEAERAVAVKESTRRRLMYAGIGASLVVLTLSGAFAFRREIVRRGAMEQATDPYRAMGFVIVDTSPRREPTVVETKGEAGCWLAVSSQTGDAPLELTLGDMPKVAGKGPVYACACEPGKVTVRGPAPSSPESAGLAVLRIDAKEVGGSRAGFFLPFQPGTSGKTDEACAEASLDAWLDAKRAPKPTADGAWLADPKRASLARAGFEVSVSAKAATPFVPVEIPAASCALALSTSREEKLALRGRGGVTVVPEAAGPIGICAKDATSLLLLRGSPTSEGAHVVTVPAAKVGGLSGLREVARLAGFPLAGEAIALADRAWSAKQALVAATVPEQLVDMATTPEIAPNPDARLVALSFATPMALTSESPDGVFSYCEPPLDRTTLDAICAFSGPQTWHLTGKDANAGIARAKLPFWLFALETANDPVALKVETQMVALSRRLRFEGFEPTTLEAVTETEKGADILGRTGEDAAIAVSLAPTPPFAFPLTDGPAWTLDGPPRVVPTKPIEKVSLVSTVKGLPSAKDKRRTVVYRRQIAK